MTRMVGSNFQLIGRRAKKLYWLSLILAPSQDDSLPLLNLDINLNINPWMLNRDPETNGKVSTPHVEGNHEYTTRLFP